MKFLTSGSIVYAVILKRSTNNLSANGILDSNQKVSNVINIFTE